MWFSFRVPRRCCCVLQHDRPEAPPWYPGLASYSAVKIPRLVSRVTSAGQTAESPYPAEPPCRASGGKRKSAAGTQSWASLDWATCQPPNPEPSACLRVPAILTALPVRQAVSNAAVQSGSLLTARQSLDRGIGGPADSWTSQPGRPATRDSHPPDGQPVAPTKPWWPARPGSVGPRGRHKRRQNPSVWFPE